MTKILMFQELVRLGAVRKPHTKLVAYYMYIHHIWLYDDKEGQEFLREVPFWDHYMVECLTTKLVFGLT